MKEAETSSLNARCAGTWGKDVWQSNGRGEKRGGIRRMWTCCEFRRRKGEIDMSLGPMYQILFE